MAKILLLLVYNLLRLRQDVSLGKLQEHAGLLVQPVQSPMYACRPPTTLETLNFWASSASYVKIGRAHLALSLALWGTKVCRATSSDIPCFSGRLHVANRPRAACLAYDMPLRRNDEMPPRTHHICNKCKCLLAVRGLTVMAGERSGSEMHALMG